MSHAIYQTPAIVLSTRNVREANKVAVLYTRDFGLVYVSAQSIREERSKMRYHLTILSFVDVDLVQGRNIWRLTGIHERTSAFSFVDTPWYPALIRVFSVIERLCQGEVAEEGIWNDLQYLYRMIEGGYTFCDEVELILLTRLLHHLGYWSGDELCVVEDNFLKPPVISYTAQHKTPLTKKVNEALRTSQL